MCGNIAAVRQPLLPWVIVLAVFGGVWAATQVPRAWVPGTPAYEMKKQVAKLRQEYGPDAVITCCAVGSVSCDVRLPKMGPYRPGT